MTRVLIVILVLLLLVTGGISATLGFFLLSARSALDTPNPVAVTIAETGKTFLIPGNAASRSNPVTSNPQVLSAAQRIYSSRCSICHGRDGKGDTPVGSHLYPRAADLTASRTQDKSAGALFWLIENGLPHTGMPGWKDILQEQEIWGLVTYLRELPEGIPVEPTSVPAVSLAATPTANSTAVPTVTAAPTQAASPATPTLSATSAPTSSSAVTPTVAAAAPTISSSATVTVTISNYYYDPPEISVEPGTRVLWLNRDNEDHDVTFDHEALPDLGTFGQDKTVSFTFLQPGRFRYTCSLHDYMEGTVTVREQGG